MDTFREYREFSKRGTPDCPFSKYHFTRSRSGTIASVHWHPELEIIYARNGCVRLHVERTDYNLEPGTIAFINPNELHGLASAHETCEYDAFVFPLSLVSLPETHFFQRDFIQPISSGNLSFPRILYPEQLAHSEISNALNQIVQCSVTDQNYKLTAFTMIMNIFTIMVTQPSMIRHTHPVSRKSYDAIKTCLQYINKNYPQKVTLQQIADQVHLCPNYLCSIFKAYTGQTLFEHLNHVRIEKAAEMLRCTELNVLETAQACGFDSVNFFVKKFTQHMGVTPKKYSKQNYIGVK